MRSYQSIPANLERKRERLNFYYKREELMLSPDGIKNYSVGSHSANRYNTALKEVQSAIRTLEQEITELEGSLEGKRPRRAIGVIARDW